MNVAMPTMLDANGMHRNSASDSSTAQRISVMRRPVVSAHQPQAIGMNERVTPISA
jgi:hypothetical protein